MKESIVQKRIVDWLDSNGYWWDRCNTGSAFVGSGKAMKRIWLMKEGTSDLIALRGGVLLSVEVKKDEKEYKRWIGVIDRYKKAVDGNVDLKIKWDDELLLHPDMKKSWKREVAQYKYAIKITRAGGHYILTYSLDHLKECLNKL